jgi:hypothetical protein
MASANKKKSKKDKAAGAEAKTEAKNRDDRSSSALLERFRGPAMKVREHRIQSCRADVRLAFANARLGIESVFGLPGDPERPANVKELKAALPELSVKKVLELPDLGRALMLAAGKVVTTASTGEIEEKLAVVRELRGPMLATAEVLAARGLFAKERVAKIRSGSGKYDLASDGVALVDLYKGSAEAVKGAHPFTDEEIEALRVASEWLVDRLTPGGAAAAKAPQKKSDEEDLRDRLWTLMLDRHSDLRAMGYYRFRDAFERQTPKLQSRIGGATRAAAGGGVEDGASGKPQGTPDDVDAGNDPSSVP